jgi:hypothetical protein
MRNQFSLGMLALTLACSAFPQVALAGHRHESPRHVRVSDHGSGDRLTYAVQVEEPTWVMVFTVSEDGCLRLCTSDRRATWIGPNCALSACLTGPACCPEGLPACGLVVVSSPTPFALPRYGKALPQLDCADGRVRPEDTRRLCRMLDLRPDGAWVTVHRLNRHPVAPFDGCPASLSACLGPNGRVFVDGRFRGLGVTALFGVEPGRRRVTVVSASGRKQSFWVVFPAAGGEGAAFGMRVSP